MAAQPTAAPSDPRESLEVFADRVMRRPLWPHQAEAAGSSAFITSIAKARRTGGSELVKILAAWTCFRERNVKTVILSAGQEASRRLTEELGADLAASNLTRASVSDGLTTRIKLDNGSEIISLPASQRAVRGLGRGVKLLVIDEAGFVPDELWRASSYVALDERASGSRILLVGTPWGGPEAFFRQAFEMGQQGDPDHGSFHWTYRRTRGSITPTWSGCVIGSARWSTRRRSSASGRMPSGPSSRGGCWSARRRTSTFPSFGELDGPTRPLGGLDWGVSFDRTALALIYRTPCAVLNPGREARPTYIVYPKVWAAGGSMNDCAREVAACRVPFRYLATETNGVGAGPSDELARAMGRGPGLGRHLHAVHTTNATKTAAYGGLLGMLENDQVVLPRHPDLLRQLRG